MWLTELPTSLLYWYAAMVALEVEREEEYLMK